MPAKLLEKLNRSGDLYGFGAVAIRGDNGALVVITEVPEQSGFSGVNVSEMYIGKDGDELRAAGTIALDQLWVLRSEAPWSIDKVAECMVRGEFGSGADAGIIEGFREIFERHAERPPVIA